MGEPPEKRMAAFDENLAKSVAGMHRDGLIRLLNRMHCTFCLDFTEEFLRTVNLDRLRHIVLSASLHVSRGASPPPT